MEGIRLSNCTAKHQDYNKVQMGSTDLYLQPFTSKLNQTSSSWRKNIYKAFRLCWNYCGSMPFTPLKECFIHSLSVVFLNLQLLVHLSLGTSSLTTSRPSLTNFLLWSLVAEYQAASVITAQNFIKTIENQQLSKRTPAQIKSS